MAGARKGGIVVKVGLNEIQVAEVLQENKLTNIDIANYNSPIQLVIAGLIADLEHTITSCVKVAVQMFIPLKISSAFHSRYMAAAHQEFAVFLEKLLVSKPRIPVISNVKARPYKHWEIKQNLIKQLTCL